MKKIYSLFLLLSLPFLLLAQASESFNYQAIVRNSAGNPITDQTVGIQVSIMQTEATGTAVYVERFSPTTNNYGLINIKIGTGDPQTGTFGDIDWSDGPYFLKIELDEDGGITYTDLGTNQLLSVPYALHANTADSIIGSYWVKDGDSLYVTGHNIGIGLTNPEEKLEVAGTVKAAAFEGDGSLLTSVDAGTLNGLQSDDFISDDDYEKYDLENLINNASFEIFSSGDNAYPDPWLLLGEEDTDTSVDRIEPGYFGSSAVRVTDVSTAKSIAIQQDIYSEGNLPSNLLNETITLSLRAKKAAASGISIGEIAINDGSARNVVSLDDTDTWHKKTITHTIASDASRLVVELWPTSSDVAETASYIFDGVMLTLGSFAPSFSLNTLDQLSTEKLQVSDLAVSNSVGVGTSNPHSSAILDLESTTKGFLPPSMTIFQRDAIESPIEGLQIFNITTKKPNYFNGTEWLNFDGTEATLIGEKYAGGIVFYVDGTGQHGLVCTENDISTTAPWGCKGTLIDGADGTAVGTGYQNTQDIESGCTTSGTAADLCANLGLNGFNDWFLPSLDELQQMYLNLQVNGFHDFGIQRFWSSSESDSDNAWIKFLNNGQPYAMSKDYSSASLRAVRAF